MKKTGLTRYGTRELIHAAVATAIACILLAWTGFWFLCIFPVALFTFILFFFRDPERITPDNPQAVFSPADGTVTHVTECECSEFFNGKVVMIGIFLSIADVHINRSPCAGIVRRISYHPGKFHDARSPESSRENEANCVYLEAFLPGKPFVLVKQIAGIIAWRIVCSIEEGQTLAAGQKFGMIKFGSRTEIYLPVSAGFSPSVQIGDIVRAGETVLGEICRCGSDC